VKQADGNDPAERASPRVPPALDKHANGKDARVQLFRSLPASPASIRRLSGANTNRCNRSAARWRTDVFFRFSRRFLILSWLSLTVTGCLFIAARISVFADQRAFTPPYAGRPKSRRSGCRFATNRRCPAPCPEAVHFCVRHRKSFVYGC
jgi:hypothetical protein